MIPSPKGDLRSTYTSGIYYVTSAFCIWALFPVYFKLIAHVPAMEVLCHRIVWGAGFCFALIAARGESKRFIRYLRQRRIVASSLLSGLLIAGNWLCFIYAVANDHVLESSLGYFLSPLLIVLLAALIYRERFNWIQGCAIGLAALAVAYQVFAYGKIPIYGLGLAFTFALYGIIRKRAYIESLHGLALETLLVMPLAVGYLIYLYQTNQLIMGTTGAPDTALLVGVGGLTALPLLLFAAGARKIPFSTTGILQYLTPTGHFLLGLFVYGEPMSFTKGVSFALIWLAVGLYMLALKRT